jgi:uroporphyrinogen decarboxylase
MHFRKPDRLSWIEWPLNEAYYRWIQEGLPISEIVVQGEEYDMHGSVPYTVSSMQLDASRYFGFEAFSPVDYTILIDSTPIPRYFTKTLEETMNYLIVRSKDGTKKKLIKKTAYSMPMYLEWPVKNRKDWEELKARLDPTDPRRYPKEWSNEYVQHLQGAEFPVSLWVGGFFNLGRSFMGTVPFVSAFYNDPEMVRDMMDFQATFIVESIRNAVETLRSAIDVFGISEDMAYKHGPHVSPKLFRELILPGYKKVTSFLKRNEIDTIFIDTDGNPNALIPLLLEGGVNGLLPLEVTAGVDAVSLRKEYGTSLKLCGNIDKRALVKGKDAIKKELDSKIPYLKEAGGYIPSVDHNFTPDIPFENFKYYAEYIKELL